MSTTRSFSAMLNDYLPNDLLTQEMEKRDWLLTNVDKDDSWVGASATSGEAAYIVPFVGAGASSIEFGSLAASTDIAQDSFVRGRETAPKEVWGSMIFNHRDLMEHGKGLNEKTFLKILPDRVEAFMRSMKEAVSTNLLSGPHFATLTSNATAGGVMGVDKIDRFQLGQKVVIDSSTEIAAYGYVIAIDVNTSEITLSLTRGGAAGDYSIYDTADSAKIYHPGNHPVAIAAEPVAQSFQSLTDALLSAANGGASTLHGVTKLAYPYMQAVNISGAAVSATNILEKLFDGYNSVRQKARGNANTILMSYKHLGSIMKLIETQKGGFKVTPVSTKASLFGWTEVEITSVKGALKIVGIQEMGDAEIIYLDPKALVFASNGMFRKRASPEGHEYFEVRATTGFSYIVDVCLFGNLIVKAPGNCGIMHSIPAY